ncbi:MAG TPA: hypothetical protein VLK65_03365 [Vicinamibacteria bacterium]|nr:hypothetical protein [Vicinamibacteria bacterium]
MPETTTAARAAATENTKPSTKYTYNYYHIPPLAMVGALTPAEAPRPEWALVVARSALTILINSIMVAVKNKGDSSEFVPEVLKALDAIAQQLDPDAKRDLSRVIAMGLEKRGAPTTQPELKVFLEGLIEPFAKTLTLETLQGIGQSILKIKTVSGPASSRTSEELVDGDGELAKAPADGVVHGIGDGGGHTDGDGKERTTRDSRLTMTESPFLPRRQAGGASGSIAVSFPLGFARSVRGRSERESW